MVRLKEAPIVKDIRIKVVGEVVEVHREGVQLHTTGKVQLYLKSDSVQPDLRYGARILVKSKFYEFEPPASNDQFDYKAYMALKQIHFKMYLREDNWRLLSTSDGISIQGRLIEIRAYLISQFITHGFDGADLGVVSALTLGDKQYLDKDIRGIYAKTGAMHVLAVSGLHVGIIYLIFNYLLQFLMRGPKSGVVKAVILLFLLWTYAAIAGFSPSICRATTMFSFIIIGNAVNRQGQIYNTIFASAFFLLLINPLFIFEVGFQLSYAAVLGIITFQPQIDNWFRFDNLIIKYFWSITAVSIAAQISTFPLAIYYFHQFPGYFFLSNIIVIPAAGAIILLAMLFFSLSLVPVVSQFAGAILLFVVKAMNLSVNMIGGLPGSTIDNLQISWLECILMYVVILSFYGYVKEKQSGYLITTLTLVLLIMISVLME
ncbi:ComEC family competence protein [Patescibacteria group bacterium]|nr:ComEC family competence protein [Patescibacteria group bacterium]